MKNRVVNWIHETSKSWSWGEDPPMMGERGCCCAVGILGKIRHVCCTSSLVEGTFYRRLLSIRYRMRLYLAIKDIVSHTCLPTRPIHSVKEAKPQGSRYPGIPIWCISNHRWSNYQFRHSGMPRWTFWKKPRTSWVEIDTSHGVFGPLEPYFMAVWSHQNTSNRMGDVSWAFLSQSLLVNIYIYIIIYTIIYTHILVVFLMCCVCFHYQVLCVYAFDCHFIFC